MKLLIRNFLALITITTITSVAEKSFGAPKPPAGSTSQLPQKLPPKKKTTKRTYIDMSNSAGVVIAPKNPSLNKALQKSEVQKNEAEVRVQSRIFVPAPPGDLSEIPSAARKPAPAPAATPVVAIAPTPVPTTAVTAAPRATPAPVILPPVPIEPLKEFSQTRLETTTRVETTVEANVEPSVVADAPVPVEEAPESTSIAEASNPIAKTTAPQTLAFVRTGYLQAKYGKFDSRMKDGATYVGLGVAREFETAWGSFEARASMNAYHAMDQSVTVDNIRMLATRTEVGYWFTRTRVRPGISLGLGWTDYSVRSYRSVGPSTDPSNQTVVLKTHAKSQAFTVIPGTSLRIEVADGLVIDTQTEFLAILGGDSADAVQGLSFGIGLGWIF